jgi:AMP phosphorylase
MSKQDQNILKVSIKDLKIDERIIILNPRDAEHLELKAGDKVVVSRPLRPNIKTIATLILSSDLTESGVAILSSETANKIDVREDEGIKVLQAHTPKSIEYIKEKMQGKKLDPVKIKSIIDEMVEGTVGKIEIMSFVLAEEYYGMDMDEVEALTRSIYESGEIIEFNKPTYDKHSIGGVPGNKVSLLIVPIIASAGLLIPKTSSRAITSPSGTADTMEVLADVNLNVEEFKNVVNKTNGALIWGGGLNLAPADDVIIRVEKILGIDPIPQMLASIMGKKMAAGIKTMVLDIPVGKETKMENIDEAIDFARKAIDLGNRVKIRIQAGITYGEQPVGHNIGPALEAKEALEALINPKEAPASLIEKSCSLAGLLLEMSGKAPLGMGHQMAKQILFNGDAYNKMREIIEAQSGNPNIKPEGIPLGDYKYEVYAPVDGFITHVSNKSLKEISRAAGAPKDKGAGLILHVKRGRKVSAKDKILEIYAERSVKLQDAINVLESMPPIVIEGMLLRTIPERKIFTLSHYESSQGSNSI